MEAATRTSTPVVEEDLRCGYSGRPCYNIRTEKKGGGLHRLCEVHRLRANENQRRVDDKRRALRSVRRRQSTGSSSSSEARKLRIPHPVVNVAEHVMITMDDVRLLRAMLFDDDDAFQDANAIASSEESE